jgi:transcriptional regulator with XRE-family HTH domain
MDFCDWLDSQLQRFNKTRKGAAAAAGISVGTIAMWKTRGNYPTLDVAFKLADYIGITVEELVPDRSPDPWLADNWGLIRDLKDLGPAELMQATEFIGFMAQKARSQRKASSAS